MKIKACLWIAVVGAFCQGCSPFANVARTMIIEPLEYSRRRENHIDMKRNAALADASWAEFSGSHPERTFSVGFVKGYKEGFTDYLYAGGAGNPPPIPPRCYWGAKYENAEGHAIIEDWFAGFREGSGAAQHSGDRKWVLIPASTALPRQSQMFATPPAAPPSIDILPEPKEFTPNPAPDGPTDKKQSFLKETRPEPSSRAPEPAEPDMSLDGASQMKYEVPQDEAMPELPTPPMPLGHAKDELPPPTVSLPVSVTAVPQPPDPLPQRK